MKRPNNKKGFTIVELVIVIAVIAILASVLIPTFTNIIEKANKSAVQQAAANIYKEIYALDLSDGKLDGNDGDDSLENATATNAKPYVYTVDDNGSVTFTYTDGDYTASLNYATGEWTVGEAGASESESESESAGA